MKSSDASRMATCSARSCASTTARTRSKSFVGAYYGHNSNNFHDRLLFDDVLAVTVKGDTVIENKALFGEVDWTFAPRWTLVTGLRYDHETNDTDIKQDDLSDAAKVKKSFAAVLPKLGINYELATGQYLGFIVQKVIAAVA